MLDVVFLVIIATFCTPSDWSDCGYIIVVPTDWVDLLYDDYATIPLEDDVTLRGFHLAEFKLIYVGEDFLFTKSEYGCGTIWHELSHADIKLDTADLEHIEMDKRYKCGNNSMQFIG